MSFLPITAPLAREIGPEFIRVYRQLLRATTYLPDSFARTYIHNHIVSRFKHHSKTNRLQYQGPHTAIEKTTKVPKTKLAVKRLKDARANARILERAGQGSIDDLKKVLLLVHGRKGLRKRELLKDLLRTSEPSVPPNNTALEELFSGTEKRAVEFVPGPKFDQFLKSQQANPPLEHPKYKIKHTSPTIPDKNLWGRPMPEKRQANSRKQWWAYTLDKLLPPVPYEEWKRLQALATGSAPVETLRPKRASVPLLSLSSRSTKTQETLEELMGPIREAYPHVDGFEFDSRMKVLTSTKHKSPEKIDSQFGRRSFRRLYAYIWSMTATMSQNPQTREWDVKWGKQRTEALSGEFTKPSQNDKELFIAVSSHEAAQKGKLDSHGRPKRKIDQFRKVQSSGRSSKIKADAKQTLTAS